MKRKVLQVTTVKIGNAANRVAVIAVANDGTVWSTSNDSITSNLGWSEWQQLPELPASTTTSVVKKELKLT